MANEVQENVNAKVTRFSMQEDEKVRETGKKTHGIAVLLKEAGFPILNIAGRADSFEIRQEFKIQKGNPYSLLELVDQGDEKNREVIDWLNTNTTKMRVVGSGIHTFARGNKAFRIVVDCTNL